MKLLIFKNMNTRKIYLKLNILLFSILFLQCERDLILEDNILYPPINVNIFYSSDGETGLEWNKTGSLAAGFRIYRKTAYETSFQLIDYTYNEYYFDYPLEYDSTYFYAISSFNEQNESDLVLTSASKPINRYKPLSPFDLISFGKNRDEISITLNWVPPAEGDIKGFLIYRDSTSNFETNASNFITLIDSFYYSDTNIIPEKRYYYKVFTIDKGELISSQFASTNEIVLRRPEIIFPQYNVTLNSLEKISFYGSKIPTVYKIHIKEDPEAKDLYTIPLTDLEPITLFNINVSDYYLSYHTNYYISITSYTNNKNIPNSISESVKILIYPQ